MGKKCFVIIDMQEDFITGSLKNPDAGNIVPVICDEIKSGDYYKIVFTQDTHFKETYLGSPEGRNLPVEHCIKYTPGWQIHPDIIKACLSGPGINMTPAFLNKGRFGTFSLLDCINPDDEGIDEIVLCGTCTDICVVTNALILKTQKPEIKITVLGYACAGLTPEKHKAALSVMESCQINVIRNKEEK